MIRVIEVLVFFAIFYSGVFTAVKITRAIRRHRDERKKALTEFVEAVKSHDRMIIVDTLAIYEPYLTKREMRVLKDLRDDILLEEHETQRLKGG